METSDLPGFRAGFEEVNNWIEKTKKNEEQRGAKYIKRYKKKKYDLKNLKMT